MGNLFKFELLKLAKKRSNIMIMFASFLITTIFFALPVFQQITYDEQGVMIKGLSAIQYDKEVAKNQSKLLTEDVVTTDLNEYQTLIKNPENSIKTKYGTLEFKEQLYWRYLVPNLTYFEMIAANYAAPYEYTWVNNIPDISLQSGAKFYETRAAKVQAILNFDYQGGMFSEQEKAFWNDLNGKIQEPYAYGYYKGWDVIFSAFELLIFPILFICVMIAPSFAGEYQSGADAIILSSKYGKTKLITAKILAAFAFATVIFILNVIIAMAIPLLTYGSEGFDLPIQIKNTISPFPLTFGEATLICLFVVYCVMLGLVSLTLFLSATLKKSLLVLMMIVMVLFAPLFLKVSQDNGLWEHIFFLFPYRSLQQEFSSYLCYSLGPITISLTAMRALVYVVLSVICLPFTRLAFVKHQVR